MGDFDARRISHEGFCRWGILSRGILLMGAFVTGNFVMGDFVVDSSHTTVGGASKFLLISSCTFLQV